LRTRLLGRSAEIANAEIDYIPGLARYFQDKALSVDVPAIMPTAAIATLSAFLHEFISPLESVRKPSLGWHDGGEHAIGTLDETSIYFVRH